MKKPFAVHPAGAVLALAFAFMAGPAIAQYKWQTPDGRTVYGDVPPPGGAQRLNERSPTVTSAMPTSAGEPTVELPYALKQAASRQPVVIYTTKDCPPCQNARDHLAHRGIPFSEKTINSVADFDAMKALGFASNGFPALSIGRERTVGFESGGWDRLLTAAGYPRESQLPANYRQASAEPMVAPTAQQVVVSVPGENRPAAGENRESQRAIDRYRSDLNSARRSTTADPAPAIRF